VSFEGEINQRPTYRTLIFQTVAELFLCLASNLC